MTHKRNEQTVVRAIERAFRGRRASALAIGLADDAALWRSSRGRETILTCDWFLEGTHFFKEKHSADAVGWKCLARAVSDIAAMGGQPRCFLLSLSVPKQLKAQWLADFLEGLRRASRALGCEPAGGDTTQSERILISMAVVGEVRRGRAILRCGARPGDQVYVSGTLGEAESGLRQLRRQRGLARATNAALRKHLYPVPRCALGQWLAENRLASAMMDLSDGLSSDLARLCAASGVGAKIEASLLPSLPPTDRNDALELALHGGDDYELLFTVRRRNARSVPGRFHGLRLTRIGEITPERKILLNTENNAAQPLEPGGWDPFRKT